MAISPHASLQRAAFGALSVTMLTGALAFGASAAGSQGGGCPGNAVAQFGGTKLGGWAGGSNFVTSKTYAASIPAGTYDLRGASYDSYEGRAEEPAQLSEKWFAQILDANGNNRLDSYRNIVTHGRAGVLMIVPGKNETLRINGPAAITTDLDLLAGLTKELRRPKAAIVIETAEIYGHCAKAFRRGHVWDPSSWDSLRAAPDLAVMYACMWDADEAAIRDALAADYEQGLAAD